jgi:hypothetical protein
MTRDIGEWKKIEIRNDHTKCERSVYLSIKMESDINKHNEQKIFL